MKGDVMLKKLLYIIATILGIIVCAVIANAIVDSLSASQYVNMVSILCIIGIAAYAIYDIALVIRDTDALNWLFRKFWKR